MRITCLFCRGPGPFRTTEHIIPASLGNDTDTIIGVVCDGCQNYLSREVEGPALTKTPIAFWRAYLGIRSRRGNLPSVHMAPPKRTRLSSSHVGSDSIGFTAHEDGSTSVDIDDPRIVRAILGGRRHAFQLVLSPWHLSILGRLLGKMGLECLAKCDIAHALQPTFDEIRNYVRYGAINKLWPIFWGVEGRIGDLRGPVRHVNGELEFDVLCYRYELGHTNLGEAIFAFSVGTDVLIACLSHPRPSEHLFNVADGIKLSCLYYDEANLLSRAKEVR